jgi:PAS domain-containing protein
LVVVLARQRRGGHSYAGPGTLIGIENPLADKDVARRWSIAIAQMRSRAAKLRRAAVPPEVLDVVDQSLSLSDAVVRELAGTGLQFDTYKMKLDEQTALWSYLFEEMPVPCVETDASGIIFNANRAAATMLNTSVKHLGARLLMHFAEDRDRFSQLLRGLSLDGSRHSSSFVIRPRERAPIHVEATVLPRSPGDSTSWLWFFMPPEQPHIGSRRHEKAPVDRPEPPHLVS